MERVKGRTEAHGSLERVGRRFGTPHVRPFVTDERERAPSRGEIVDLYRKRARRYDRMSQLYRLIGFRLDRYRRMVADALALEPGATVVEIGCGTGANFPELTRRVGPTGKIIGVDVLDAARARIEREGWDNVELVRCDAASYEFPPGIEGILSTLALSLSPDYDAIIERGARALTPGGRWVVLDLKLPDWPRWAVDLALFATRPYGVRLGQAERRPWESMRRYLPHIEMRELYLGAAYLLIGSNVGTPSQAHAASRP